MDEYIRFIEKGLAKYTKSVDTKTLDDLSKIAGVVNIIRMYKDSEKHWDMREKELRANIRTRDEENEVLRRLNDTYRAFMDRQANGKA